MGDLTLTIEADGTLIKYPDPWPVGTPGTIVHATLINKTNDYHRVEMRWFEHSGTGKKLKPLTGATFWQAFGYQSDRSEHKVRNHGKPYYGKYKYVTAVDGVEGPDPEIVVDEPPPVGPPKRTALAIGAAIGGLVGLVGGALVAQADDAPPIVRQQRLVTSIVLGGVCAAVGAWVAGSTQRR